jgi:predicted ATPase
LICGSEGNLDNLFEDSSVNNLSSKSECQIVNKISDNQDDNIDINNLIVKSQSMDISFSFARAQSRLKEMQGFEYRYRRGTTVKDNFSI